MERRRPAAQRNPNQAVDVFDIAKSVPDLLDSKYTDFRRPWYKNPDYKGPRNVILSTNQLNSPQGSMYSLNSIQTLHRHQYPTMLRNSAQQIKYGTVDRQFKNRREHVKISNANSDTTDGHSFFSFENLNRDGPDISHRNIKISSSPDSPFSSYNSNYSSPGRQSHQGSNSKSPSIRINQTIKTQSRSKPNSISPRHRGLDFVEEKTIPKSFIKTGFLPVGNRAKESQLEQCSCQRNQYSNYEIIGTRGDPVYPSHGQDEKNIKKCRKRINSQSDDSDLTSVTDDDFSTSSVPTRSQRPIPGTSKAWCEALFFVFAFLDMRSLARCGAVSKQWRHVSRHPVLWRKIRMNECCISPDTFILLKKWCTEVTEISLQQIRTVTKVIQPNENNVLELNILESSLVKLLEINKITLKTMRIIDCDDTITKRVLWAVSTLCSNLTKIVYLSRISPLGQEDLYPLGRGCPGITTLIIPPGWPCLDPGRFADVCCETISKSWTKLQVLCIGGRNLTIKGLEQIARGCVKLQHLELDHGPEITEECASKMVAIGLRGLEKLDFTFTPISPRAVVIFNNACPRLCHIGIHCNITDYFSDHKSSKSKSHFNSLKTLFRRLKSRPGFEDVLDVNLDYEY